MKTLIKNSNIITPYKIIYGGSIGINDGKITGISSSNLKEDDFDRVIDGKGNYISAGFIDIHNHGNYGHEVMEGTKEALESMAKFHLKNGVLGFLATTMTASHEDTINAIENTAKYMKNNNIPDESNPKAYLFGLHLEGPYFSMKKKGAQPAEFIKNPCIEEIKSFIEASENNVRLMAISPELPHAIEAIAFLKSRGITVSAGHSDATYDETMLGIENGITEATHLYNGMREFSHREPGIIGAALTDERVACEMICDGIHVSPAAMKLAVKMKGRDKIILISDAMMAAGLKDGAYTLGVQKVFVKDGAARLAEGNLAGSTLTLNRAVYNIVHLAGVKLEDAVRMASLNPARAIGIEKKKGSIELGKDADLIMFNDKLDINAAIIGGRIMFNK